MKGSSIWVEIDKCLACKTCEVECAMAHCEVDDIVEAIAVGLRPERRVSVTPVSYEVAVPIQCRHCEDAPCVAVCPSGALTKLGPDQAVVLDGEKCIGCKSCVIVCPFGAVVVGTDGRTIVKCDLCAARLEQGQSPACVSGCPTGALHFGEVDEIAREARKKAARQLLEAMLAEVAEGEG
jgi:carbon-monoxide dehydrogenase iron sulfur subunit